MDYFDAPQCLPGFIGICQKDNENYHAFALRLRCKGCKLLYGLISVGIPQRPNEVHQKIIKDVGKFRNFFGEIDTYGKIITDDKKEFEINEISPWIFP